MNLTSSPETSSRLHERRRSPRLQILGELHGHLVAVGLEMIIRDVSFGGLSVDSQLPFPVGVVHRFRLSVGDRSLTVSARVVHSRQIDVADGPPRFRTGLEFVTDTPEARQAVEAIIDRMTSVLQFD
jgi:hypothetical protein